ncbi:MAG: hypothetical protein A2821_00510 [Candidatus Magasanikbacteria bacterium RIFCSPHIGHO2_01_FULL_41_23]|uniref:Sugar 3,4-ketoisomerase QdtA cupin domain-containing protein n=1 Tax=Candidatus Magasanikbacteria bacterium RIFCSPLOWO2_01_FULL_40_15 TaxID=1798686 RepID=A0A1F6N134_9BACT|nr:MAG: hypothetical protein A2821_00510 [Candidatus Magasanikbacteria bacterium RIFCSPHIGHO2_01_FULL_41_23]OGH74660.1 MAG: hypothetical protein A3F22_01865 [Candidatus Magasanikbacteria bacterium RIFCSPHIGHO2_12_FULL_41_16]OGH77373.1 MAG: hypothetical protein A2983_01565 [Candidatus Magasanikbacteria bacterium RIFCSPLOWO2_01_FULL_40_15]
MKQFQKIDLKTFTNRDFNLTPVEFKDVIPFDVKRMYYFSDIKPDKQTGEHCHYVEEEFFFVARGAITAIIDSGKGKEEMRLEGPNTAIYVPNYVWHGFKNASADCMMIALTSTNYNPDRGDYLENYEEYLKIRGEHLK